MLVASAGPAGLAAVAEAARGGADVLFVEAGPELGGTLARAPGLDAAVRAEALAAPGLRLMTGATVTGVFADNWVAAVQGGTLWRVRARRVILATVGIEQPAVFSGNDRPGILSAGAVRRLVRLWAVAPGRRAVDLRAGRFAPDAIAQTRFAGLDAVVLRRHGGAEALFDVTATGAVLRAVAQAAASAEKGGLP